MPIYEFTCDTCGKTRERKLRVLDRDIGGPYCHQEPMRRLVSRSNFSLKGNGWAKDGYGSKT